MTQAIDSGAAGTDAAVRGVTTVRGLRQVARFVSWHPWPFALAMGGAALYAALTVGSAVVLGRVVDDVVLPVFDGEPLTDRGVLLIVGGVLGIAVLRAAGVLGRRYYAGMLSERVQSTLRARLAGHYLRVPVDWIERRSVGTLLAHAEADVETAGQALHPVPLSGGAALIAVLAFGVMLATDPVLAVVGLLIFPALAVANQVYSGLIAPPAARVQDGLGRVSGIAGESFDGALVVKTLGREAAEVERFTVAAERLRDDRISVGYLRAWFETGLDVLPTAGMIVVAVLGAFRVDAGQVTAGDVVLVVNLFSLLVFPMRVFGFLLESLPPAVVAQDRIDDALGDDVDGPPAPAPATGGAVVTFDAVHFAYPGSAPVLRGVDLRIEPGEVVALVGPTGTGKSTVVDLLAGLREPTSGSVTVAGRDARELVGSSEVATAFQEAFLFAGTVADNIELGRGIDDDGVIAAAVLAEAHEFVSGLPHGYGTIVGERGVTLSGGQRQRVALARALAGRPSVLVLDDATSAVDPRIEQRILDRLRAQAGTTTLLVAQRVATIALADRVAFLTDDGIRAVGTHAELLASDPAYEALVRAYE